MKSTKQLFEEKDWISFFHFSENLQQKVSMKSC